MLKALRNYGRVLMRGVHVCIAEDNCLSTPKTSPCFAPSRVLQIMNGIVRVLSAESCFVSVACKDATKPCADNADA
jgi:hypothetical protein